jgi:hypothetical protein
MISKVYENKDGSYLRVFDFSKIPFEVKRMFVISSENNEICQRGAHAHYKCHQVLTCMQGQVEVGYENAESKGAKILRPGESFFHGNMEWLNITFTEKNSMLLSLCSEKYNEEDYIRDYKVFKKLL